MADNFKHHLIIAADEGVFLLREGVWNNPQHRVKDREYEDDEGLNPGADPDVDPSGGSWQVLRELLQCGATVAVVPPKLPPDPDGKPKPQPRGTCFVVNLAAFKLSNRYHVK